MTKSLPNINAVAIWDCRVTTREIAEKVASVLFDSFHCDRRNDHEENSGNICVETVDDREKASLSYSLTNSRLVFGKI